MLFRQFVEAGSVAALAGQVGLKDGTLVAGGVGAQTTQAIENMKSVLAEHGRTLDDVIQVTVYLVDMTQYDAMNAAYLAGFDGCSALPARATVGVAALAGGFGVELVALAATGR